MNKMKIYGNGCIRCGTIEMFCKSGIVAAETAEYIGLEGEALTNFEAKYPNISTFPIGIIVVEGEEQYIPYDDFMDVFKKNKVPVADRVKIKKEDKK